MLTLFQSLILGGLQGVSELFPISSLGHSVILPGILGWRIDQQDPFFLIFLVATHFATALVLFFFFLKDWKRILGGFFRSFREREIREDDPDAKLAWLLIVSTIPAGIIGLLFEKQIKDYFIAPRSAALFLAANGILLFGAEFLRRRARKSPSRDGDARIAKLSWTQGLKVGTMQTLALIPGFSRTGATIAGGLLAGLSHEDAARFSFLLATPIIAGAALLKLPELIVSFDAAVIGVAAAGAAASAISAYLAVKFLTRYFGNESRTLSPFATYCLLAGIAASLYLVF